MPGRIEHYIHSDSITENKAGVIVTVQCDTDFAAKTSLFRDFVKEVAKYVFASGKDLWEDVVEVFPDLENQRLKIEKEIKEKVRITNISLHKL